MHFSRDVDLWELSTQVGWGSHNLCPLSHIQVREITMSQLYALSQAGAWGDIEKPKHDIVFLLIAPDKVIKGERVFSLLTMWMHLHQAHHHSLGEVACNVTPLINIGTDWTYGFAQLNEGMLHTPLSSEGHISAMTDSVPSMNTCGCLSQL